MIAFQFRRPTERQAARLRFEASARLFSLASMFDRFVGTAPYCREFALIRAVSAATTSGGQYTATTLRCDHEAAGEGRRYRNT
jgi:hypothetical protein